MDADVEFYRLPVSQDERCSVKLGNTFFSDTPESWLAFLDAVRSKIIAHLGRRSVESLAVNSYQLDEWGDGTIDVTLMRTLQYNGSSLWKIFERGFVINKDGEWELEPIPSSRKDDFIKRTRFESAQAALEFWNSGLCKSRFEHYRTKAMEGRHELSEKN